MKKIIFLLSLVLTIAPVYSAFDGGVTAPILSYSLGSRAYAMGGAYTALADDSTSCFWNPAGLVQIHRQEVSGYFEFLFAGGSFFSVGYSYPIWNVGVASATFMYMGASEIQAIDPYLQDLGMMSTYQFLLNLSFAQKLSYYKKYIFGLKYFDAGVNVKLFGTGLNQESGSLGKVGVGIDLGLKYYPSHFTFKGSDFLKNMVVGLKFNNLLPPTVKFDSQRDWYMPEMTLGLLYRTLYDTLNITFDIQKTFARKRDFRPRVGAEYTVFKLVRLRVGYNGELTFGAGINLEDFKFDYAAGYNFDLGFLHHISATYYFGEIVP